MECKLLKFNLKQLTCATTAEHFFNIKQHNNIQKWMNGWGIIFITLFGMETFQIPILHFNPARGRHADGLSENFATICIGCKLSYANLAISYRLAPVSFSILLKDIVSLKLLWRELNLYGFILIWLMNHYTLYFR